MFRRIQNIMNILVELIPSSSGFFSAFLGSRFLTVLYEKVHWMADQMVGLAQCKFGALAGLFAEGQNLTDLRARVARQRAIHPH